MATLTPTLALTSTDATGDTLSLSVTDSLAIGANKVRLSRTYSPDDVSPGGVQIFSTNLGPSYMYLKNTHATLKIHIQAAADTAESAAWMELKAGEFAFFCWAGVVDLFASTGDNGAGIATDGLEVIIFEI
tara:strand:- start:641 stop:1033 length:393 start_codon:yes stop_codon:yes gene_type:complete